MKLRKLTQRIETNRSPQEKVTVLSSTQLTAVGGATEVCSFVIDGIDFGHPGYPLAA